MAASPRHDGGNGPAHLLRPGPGRDRKEQNQRAGEIMMAVIETIAPIFLIILFGSIIQRKGFLKNHFIQETNRFVFLFPLPALIFTGIIKSSMRDMTASNIAAAIIPTIVIFAIAFGTGIVTGLRHGKLGSFVQTTFHGNVSYIGLAVLFYMLGEEGLKKGSILIGILILLNNSLAIAVLSWTSGQHRSVGKALLSIVTSPVIVATFVGLLVLYSGIPIPSVVMRSMVILANIALPMALILIGASISMGTIRQSLGFSALSSVLKLALLPGLALAFCKIVGIPLKEALPVIILLATPTATTSYIMAREMGGDIDIASGAVTLSTLLSPIAFVVWTWAVR
jgi:predicted permease